MPDRAKAAGTYPLQGAPGLFATPLGRLLLAIVVLAVVVLVGRVVLAVAWKLLVLAALVVGACSR